jgi:hypothetical protein
MSPQKTRGWGIGAPVVSLEMAGRLTVGGPCHPDQDAVP